MDFEEFVLAASTADLDDVAAAREYADAIEFRLDLATAGVDAIPDGNMNLPLIVTNRVEWEGGEAADTPGRLDALCDAIARPAVEAVDVELATLRAGDGDRVLSRAREHDVTVVVSTHDFEGTPGRDRLRELLSRASEWGDVAKLAVTGTSPDDVLDLLTVTRAATVDGERVATMAMGEVGRHSRVVAPLYGSRIGYAPLDPERATAPGQYDLPTFRTLHGLLQKEGYISEPNRRTDSERSDTQ